MILKNFCIKNLSYLITLGSEGGIFEILVIYDILFNQKFFDISVPDFIRIRVKSIVSQNYSLKFFSHWQKEKLYKKAKINKVDYDIEKLIDEAGDNKINLGNNGILIIQENSNGKYYDTGILIPVNDNEDNNNSTNIKRKFKLLLAQISINKPKEKWLLNTVHEINFYFAKKNLENKYNIEIISGYFYYILKKEHGKIIDTNTFNNNLGKCLLYDIKKGFSSDKILLNENSFITDKFQIFNESTLIKNNKADKLLLNTINKMITNQFRSITEILFEILDKSLKNENKNKALTKKQFHIIGNVNMITYIQFMTSFFIFIQKMEIKSSSI